MKIMNREMGFFVECKSVDIEGGVVTIIHPVSGKEVRAPARLYDLEIKSMQEVNAKKEEEKKRMKAAATENDRRYWRELLLSGEPGEDYVYQFGRVFVMNGDRKEFRNTLDEFSLEKNSYMKIKIREEVIARFKNYDVEMFQEMFFRMLRETEALEEKGKINEAWDRFIEWAIEQR